MLGVQSGWGREGKWSLSPLTDDIDNGVVAPALRCAHLTLKDTWRKWEWRYWAPPAPLGGDGHWRVWYRVVHYCTQIDELCVPTDETSWVFLN